MAGHDLTRLTRYPERGFDDRGLLDQLLDEVPLAVVCSVLDGEPWSIPTLVARDGDRLLVHGSSGAGLFRHLAQGAPATVTVATMEAHVIAPTAFDHSANYRSAVVRGRFRPVADKDAAARALTDQLVPGRGAEVPPNTAKQLAATLVLELAITDDNWTYKARSGGSGEQAAGEWTGIVPVRTVLGQPVADEGVDPDVEVPASVRRLVQGHR